MQTTFRPPSLWFGRDVRLIHRAPFRDTEQLMRAFSRLLMVLATLAPATLAAQSRRLDVIPGAGFHSPREALGAAALIGPGWFVTFGEAESSAAFAAAAEVTRPGHSLGARLSGFVTMPAAAHASFRCRPGLSCPDVIVESESEITTANLFADLVYDLWNSGRIRPWLAAGAGLRRYNISWEAPAVLLDTGSHSETIPALHVAVGTDIRVGPGAVRAEIGAFWSANGARVPPAENPLGTAPTVAGRAAQRDFLVSLGWRVLRF